jgi:hypothetical protein
VLRQLDASAVIDGGGIFMAACRKLTIAPQLARRAKVFGFDAVTGNDPYHHKRAMFSYRAG